MAESGFEFGIEIFLAMQEIAQPALTIQEFVMKELELRKSLPAAILPRDQLFSRQVTIGYHTKSHRIAVFCVN